MKSVKISTLKLRAALNGYIIGGVAGAAGIVIIVAGVVAYRNRKNRLLRESQKLSSASLSMENLMASTSSNQYSRNPPYTRRRTLNNSNYFAS